MESPRRSRLTEADTALWAEYASGIRPLPGRKRLLSRQVGPGVARSVGHALAESRSGAQVLPPLAIGTHPGGVDNASWNRLRTGKLQTARVLDLHGYTAQRAYNALGAFLRAAQAEGVRCVEVITGQGGVLRRELPLWLNLPEFRSLVLAAAHPHAANPGSVRLLLRRSR
jgi:DNA-nicking Smr family endonuclease